MCAVELEVESTDENDNNYNNTITTFIQWDVCYDDSETELELKLFRELK